jgi:Phosphoribosyl-ATP pyrophosphohydrolase
MKSRCSDPSYIKQDNLCWETNGAATPLKGLDQAFYDVRVFHKTFSHPAPSLPTLIPEDDVVNVRRWIESECRELFDATTIVDQVDAGIDIIYFGLGILVRLGVAPSKIWDIVHGCNMTKEHTAEDGTRFVKKNEQGKVVKPDGWKGPEEAIQAEITDQILEAPLAVADLLARVSE